jgi:RNA polymerase sigma-70 factor (ECF subfamily)
MMALRPPTGPYGQLSDEILASRVAQGDATAFEILYDRYAPTVLGIALKIIDDRTLAENLLQETFWQLWQSASMYRPESGSFTGWLFRTARQLAMKAYSQRAHS